MSRGFLATFAAVAATAVVVSASSSVSSSSSSFSPAQVALKIKKNLHLLPPLPSSLDSSSPPSPSLTCDACQYVVSIAQVIAENSTTIDEVIAIMDEGCTVIGDPSVQALCDGIMKDLIDLLPWIDTQLRTLAWDIPLAFCSTFFPVCTLPCCETDSIPEQMYLSLTNSPTEMAITWTTLNVTTTSTVQWGPAVSTSSISSASTPTTPSSTSTATPLPYSTTGTTRTYVEGGWLGVIHTAIMTSLLPGTSYSYRVGDNVGGWSDVYNFTTLPSNVGTPAMPLRIVQIGDMAYDENSNFTIQQMTELAMTPTGSSGTTGMHVVLHIGDIGYADGYMSHWDMHLRKVSPVLRLVPLLACRGNHELWYNFTAYKSRIGASMPLVAMDPINNPTVLSTNNGSYYAVNLGANVHLNVFNTETSLDTADVDAEQQAWLKADLSNARANANMTWVIAGAHRPLYCTNSGGEGSDCGTFASVLRSQIEQTFITTKTDLILAAHMHGWERTWPVINNATVSTSYISPQAPVYIVNGAGGNREGNELPHGNRPWSPPGGQSGSIGYGIMTIIADPGVPGGSSLQYQFIQSTDNTVLDNFTITK